MDRKHVTRGYLDRRRDIQYFREKVRQIIITTISMLQGHDIQQIKKISFLAHQFLLEQTTVHGPID